MDERVAEIFEESITRQVRRVCCDLSDQGVDRLAAGAAAHHRDLVNHGRSTEAELMWMTSTVLNDVRAERRQLREAVLDALALTRDLTPEELGEGDG